MWCIMPDERDPRKNPTAGDKFLKNGIFREVLEFYPMPGDHTVTFLENFTRKSQLNIKSWKEWAKNAQLVTHAG